MLLKQVRYSNMLVKVTHLGCVNRPIDGVPNYIHRYLCEAANGLIQETEEYDFIPNGTYELPDKDWTYDENEDYGEDLIDEQDLLGSPTT